MGHGFIHHDANFSILAAYLQNTPRNPENFFKCKGNGGRDILNPLIQTRNNYIFRDSLNFLRGRSFVQETVILKKLYSFPDIPSRFIFAKRKFFLQCKSRLVKSVDLVQQAPDNCSILVKYCELPGRLAKQSRPFRKWEEIHI